MQIILQRLLLLVHICYCLPDLLNKCLVDFNTDRKDLETLYQIECSQISTPEDVLVLKNALENSTLDDASITVFLDSSQLDLIPADLFSTHKVTNLMFHNSNMSMMPYDLLCSKNVRLITLINNPIPGSSLTPGGFRNCSELQYLSLRNTTLTDIPAGSFQGLDSLVELWLLYNNIHEVPDLSGLEKSLTRLVLAFNPISFIGKHAFRNMHNLTSLILQYASITGIQDGTFDDLGPEVQVSLSENPLHCDCSLDWLKQWLKQHPLKGPQSESYGIPTCATPMVGPLMKLNFCNRTIPTNITTTEQNSAVVTTGSNRKIAFVLMLLLLSY